MSNLFHGVPLEIICKQHLQGIWKELHQVLGSLKKGRSIQGHMEDSQVFPEHIWDRMLRVYLFGRQCYGINFQMKYTPIEIEKLTLCLQIPETGLERSICAYNTWKLLTRCPTCRQRMYEVVSASVHGRQSCEKQLAVSNQIKEFL